MSYISRVLAKNETAAMSSIITALQSKFKLESYSGGDQFVYSEGGTLRFNIEVKGKTCNISILGGFGSKSKIFEISKTFDTTAKPNDVLKTANKYYNSYRTLVKTLDGMDADYRNYKES